MICMAGGIGPHVTLRVSGTHRPSMEEDPVSGLSSGMAMDAVLGRELQDADEIGEVKHPYRVASAAIDVQMWQRQDALKSRRDAVLESRVGLLGKTTRTRLQGPGWSLWNPQRIVGGRRLE